MWHAVNNRLKTNDVELKMLVQLLTCRLKGHIARTNNFDEEEKIEILMLLR